MICILVAIVTILICILLIRHDDKNNQKYIGESTSWKAELWFCDVDTAVLHITYISENEQNINSLKVTFQGALSQYVWEENYPSSRSLYRALLISGDEVFSESKQSCI